MRRIRLAFFAGIAALGISPIPAAAHDTPLAAFFDLVAVGSVSSFAEALTHEPDLAVKADKYGFSAVHVLDYLGFEDKLALLQRFGADINARNDEGHALLHIIMDPALIPVAVAAGADANLGDYSGRTPLMVHLSEPDGADFVPAFVAAGADLNARDAKGKSVLDYAVDRNDPALTEMLLAAGAKP